MFDVYMSCRSRHSPTQLHWPPLGKRLTVEFEAPASLPQYRDVAVEVVYEMYDNSKASGHSFHSLCPLTLHSRPCMWEGRPLYQDRMTMARNKGEL